MVPILILGAWISILCSLNKSTLLGLGQPRYAAIGSAARFIWLLIALPLSLSHVGFVGCIMVIAVSDIFRYAAAFLGLMATSDFVRQTGSRGNASDAGPSRDFRMDALELRAGHFLPEPSDLEIEAK